MAYGLYDASGNIRTTTVTGTAITGLYAFDGSWNIILDDASHTGLYHPCGALRVNSGTSTNRYDPSGAIYSNSLGVPPWVPPAAQLLNLFVNLKTNQAWQKQGNVVVPASSIIMTSRASVTQQVNSAGVWSQVAANAPAINDLGLTIEEARTNSIRNNTMQGAAAGTPGTFPTDWSGLPTGVGLSQQIISTGTQQGIDVISIRYFGTATSTGTVNLQMLNAPVIASLGQTYNFSTFLSYIVNSGSNPQFGAEVDELVSGTFLAGSQSTNTISVGAPLARFDLTRTLNQATVNQARGYFRILITTGLTYDFTVTLGWPQFELGASASSPIKTTNAAVTRAADFVTINFAAIGNPVISTLNYFMYAKVTPLTPITYASPQNFLQIDDGHDLNRSLIRRQATTGRYLAATVGAGGSNPNISPATILNPNVAVKAAARFAVNDVATYLNAVNVGTGSPSSLPINPAFARLGSSDGISLLNGNIEEFAFAFAQYVPDTTMQALTT